MEVLGRVPLLAKLTEQERAQLASKLTKEHFKARAEVIKQGTEGDGFYIIEKGEVVVTRQDEADVSSVSELGRLRAGDYFGEVALLSSTRRGATVSALTELDCLYLRRQDFADMFGSHRLNVQFAKRKAVSSERVPENYTPSVPVGAVKDKDAKTKQLILNAVKFNVLFMNLSPAHQALVVDDMYQLTVRKGVAVINQGDFGDNFYVVQSGEFHIFVDQVRVAIRGRGTCFGEVALMYNAPRAATVCAAEDSIVWVIDRFTFKRIVVGVTKDKLSSYLAFLHRVPILAPLAEYEREKIAEALEEVSFRKDQVICKQGEDGDEMFIVQSGELVVHKEEAGVVSEVNRVKVGEFFGERALVKNAPRAASVTAVTDCVLLKLDRNAFSLLLGPLEDLLQERVNSYESRVESKVALPPRPPPRANECKVEFADLQVLGTLGKGSFGHVQLVRDRKGGKTYALKAVWKAQIVQTGQQGHIMSEKRAMAALSHPFLVALYATFKSRDRLYFLLEPSLGGELFSVLREKTLFDEDTARFYAAHIVLAFEYMHSMNYVYRDLKPENLLLDSSGYLKLTDFGFAKDISSGRTWTLCGTPDYLAPEIVAGKGHGKGVDWWTLGIFIYEMLASYPPFYDEDPMKTYAKIMNGSITFPSQNSKEAISLIKKLLYHKPTKRLGVVNGSAKLIKKHAWFRTFSWTDLLDRKLKAPFVPKIKDDADISNFDDYGEDEEEQQPYADDGTGWDRDF